eukprot:scaffold124785_cov18-Tisochrysis_lutea.AAC.1
MSAYTVGYSNSLEQHSFCFSRSFFASCPVLFRTEASQLARLPYFLRSSGPLEPLLLSSSALASNYELPCVALSFSGHVYGLGEGHPFSLLPFNVVVA